MFKMMTTMLCAMGLAGSAADAVVANDAPVANVAAAARIAMNRVELFFMMNSFSAARGGSQLSRYVADVFPDRHGHPNG